MQVLHKQYPVLQPGPQSPQSVPVGGSQAIGTSEVLPVLPPPEVGSGAPVAEWPSASPVEVEEVPSSVSVVVSGVSGHPARKISKI